MVEKRLSHRIVEIRRRLSVLEKKLDIVYHIARDTSLYDEITTRLSDIGKKIKEIPELEKSPTKLQIDEIQDTLSEFESILNITSAKNPDAPEPKPKTDIKYEVNFIKSNLGNAIRTGTKMKIRIRNADSVLAAIYKNGVLILGNQSHKNDEDKKLETTSILLKKRRITRLGLMRKLEPGTYKLHVWFWDKETNEQGTYKDNFEIIP